MLVQWDRLKRKFWGFLWLEAFDSSSISDTIKQELEIDIGCVARFYDGASPAGEAVRGVRN